ncbi:phage holin family protein [Nocardioides sp. B-3]|uniref:phage holin family protein n=1 Tax=Nocardioides sp. B-3 TaxID=2895565 RepID=UPI0021530666|nr:phage holin family protein [Nocardioides sp. B-3]UUZ58563.1 phage holin family protein [Nocardioides sp. B-3]
MPDLIRSEMRLAQAEMTEKVKAAGPGLGMFSAAGVLAFFALATLITTAIPGLSNVVEAWLAALIVALELLVAAAIAGLVGRKKVTSAGPPKPELALGGLRGTSPP